MPFHVWGANPRYSLVAQPTSSGPPATTSLGSSSSSSTDVLDPPSPQLVPNAPPLAPVVGKVPPAPPLAPGKAAASALSAPKESPAVTRLLGVGIQDPQDAINLYEYTSAGYMKMNAFLWPRTADQIRRLLTENPIDAVVDSIMPGLEHQAREDAVQMVLKLRGAIRALASLNAPYTGADPPMRGVALDKEFNGQSLVDAYLPSRGALL